VQGWSDVTTCAMELWDGGDRKGAAALLPEEFLDTLVLAGDTEDVRQRFEAYRTAGVDEPAAFLVSGQSDLQAVRAELERRPRPWRRPADGSRACHGGGSVMRTRPRGRAGLAGGDAFR